ncbi:Hypothetical protein, putative [Bodo saltans]|uniref:Membrane-associated protein n=1 Tax=Bodo saltans TaxID=75058 RepID=A0A0S4J9B5_BODSA|nr:Hypothetical protein, putative [Bodo saltans]|eukprot:CUG88092.1 Hypothetical protein, putative [Bodo saltans]
MRFTATITMIASALLSVSVTAEPVKVIALDFVGLAPLVGATMDWLETGASYITDADGVVMLDAPVGASVTINFSGNDKYHQTQSSTVEVPAGGLTTLYNQLVMQVPTHFLFDVFWTLSPGEHKNTSNCQVVVTVCDVNKTVYSHAQGLPGTVATLTPALESQTFYFGTWGKLSNDTNPLPNNLTSTSFDGGVLFENLAPNPDQWYEVTASHPGYSFSSTRFRCLKAGFVNAAPNQGPRATPL